MIDVPMDDAVTLLLPPRVQTQLTQLRERIPEGLRGLFFVSFSAGLNNAPTLPIQGLRLQPDVAIAAYNRLQGELTRISEGAWAGVKSTMNHGTGLLYNDDERMLFKEFNALLRNDAPLPSPVPGPVSVESDLHIGMETIREYYTHQGLDYADSYRLQDVLGMRGLPWRQAEGLKRIAAMIPTGIRDIFACDLLRTPDGQLTLGGISLAPDMVMTQLSQTALKPLVDYYQAQRPGHTLESRDLHLATHIKRHGVKLRFTPEQVEALGAGLRGSGQAIAS